MLCAALLLLPAKPVRVFAEESEVNEQTADQKEDQQAEKGSAPEKGQGETKETEKAGDAEKKAENTENTEKGDPDDAEEEIKKPEDMENGKTEDPEKKAPEDDGPEDGGETTEEATQSDVRKEDGNPEEEQTKETDEEEPVVVAFYTMDEEETYYKFAEEEADEEGHAEFPNVPEIEGYVFDFWQTEDFKNVSEDTVFTEDCSVYAVFGLSEAEFADMPVMYAAKARAGSIGISATDPQAGQQNRYEYSGAETTWTVPADGYYKITCGGAQGGRGKAHYRYGDPDLFFEHDGSNGDLRACMCLLKKGSVLTLHTGGMGGEGNPEYVSNDYLEGTSDNGGYSDGGRGTFKSYRCKDCGGSVRAGGGGGGGSSYVLYQSVKIISAKGGNGGDAQANGEQGRITIYKSGAAGGGTTARSDADGIRWLPEELDTAQSGVGSGNGYITITAAAIFPGIELTASTEEWTNEDVTVTATVVNTGEGLPDKYLSWETDEEGNPVWTSEARYTVSQNGTYHCKIRDTAGNMTEETIEITNIDKLPPDAELTADITEWTTSDIELTAAAEDAAEDAEYGQSGLEDAAYLWGMADTDGSGDAAEGEDSGETGMTEAWTDESRYTVSRNGTYACRIRDKAGNITECICTVSNIDRTPPEIRYEKPDKWYDGEADIIWTGNDLQPDGTAGSGLADEAYSFDGINFTASNILHIPGAGVYKVWIRDKVGNTAEYDIEINYDHKSSSKGENTVPPVAELPALPAAEPADNGGGNGAVDGIVSALPEPVKARQPEPEEILPVFAPMPEPIRQQKTSLKTPPEKPENEDRKEKTLPDYGRILNYITKGTATATGGIVIYFVLFHVLYSAGVLAMNADKEYVYIGRRRVKKRNGRYQIRIDQYLYSKADTEFFLIKPGKKFVKQNQGRLMTIVYQKKKLSVIIDNEIKVRIAPERK